MILAVALEVLGQILDPLGQYGNLQLGRSCICLTAPELLAIDRAVAVRVPLPEQQQQRFNPGETNQS